MSEIEAKHRSTISPFECSHCGLVWYGMGSSHPAAPEIDLCSSCWRGLEHYLVEHHREELDENADTLPVYAQAWIQDKTKAPLPRTPDRRFHSSVPKWMRSAISQAMVKPNDHDVYVVYSRNQIATRAEVLDEEVRRQARLKQMKRGRR